MDFGQLSLAATSEFMAHGVIVMRDGTIKGGDANYYYEGFYEAPDPTSPKPALFKAKVT